MTICMRTKAKIGRVLGTLSIEITVARGKDEMAFIVWNILISLNRCITMSQSCCFVGEEKGPVW